MNKLTYRIDDGAIKALYPKHGMEIVLDDVPTGYFFNLEDFEKSSEKDGYYLVFEGPCQVTGCCGVYAQVVNEGDKIIWKRFFVDSVEEEDDPLRKFLMPGSDTAHEVGKIHIHPDRIISPPLEFNKDEYVKLVRELKNL